MSKDKLKREVIFEEPELVEIRYTEKEHIKDVIRYYVLYKFKRTKKRRKRETIFDVEKNPDKFKETVCIFNTKNKYYVVKPAKDIKDPTDVNYRHELINETEWVFGKNGKQEKKIRAKSIKYIKNNELVEFFTEDGEKLTYVILSTGYIPND